MRNVDVHCIICWMVYPRVETSGAKAERLESVRGGIDAVDESVVRDLIFRGALVKKAGRQKPLGVTSPERQQEVIEHVRKVAHDAAATQGATLDGMPELVVEMYEWMLPRIVELQQAQLAGQQIESTPERQPLE